MVVQRNGSLSTAEVPFGPFRATEVSTVVVASPWQVSYVQAVTPPHALPTSDSPAVIVIKDHLRRDLDPFPGQFPHDWAHLIGGENEIAHDQRLIPLASKGEPGAKRQRRLQLHAIEQDLEIGARKANAVDTARHLRAGFAELPGHPDPNHLNREGRSGQSGSEHQTQQPSDRGHHHLLSVYVLFETAALSGEG
jgi:hypothetical protein